MLFMSFYPRFQPLSNIQKMLLRFCICFGIVLLNAFSLFLFLLFPNLFCKIVLLVKCVNHFDRKKNKKKTVLKIILDALFEFKSKGKYESKMLNKLKRNFKRKIYKIALKNGKSCLKM